MYPHPLCWRALDKAKATIALDFIYPKHGGVVPLAGLEPAFHKGSLILS